MKQPFQLFSEWFEEELTLTTASITTTVCLSTIGLDGFPNARFVSFKEIIDNSFIITGSLNSRKGFEIEKHNKVALTFWWPETERQIRVQGEASKITEQLADLYFYKRSAHSQAVSAICEQGNVVDDIKSLEEIVFKKALEETTIKRPKNWGGISIQPIRIEFMQFKKSRFHNRKLYEIENGIWSYKQLQP